MDFFSADARLWISIVSGLVGGAGGGLATAGAIAVRATRANERFRATSTVRGILNSYRALLIYEHDEHYRVDRFSDRYASFEGQLELAESILVQLPTLKSGKRNRIRQGLLSLVGEITLGQAEKRVYLPEEMRDAEDGNTRRVVAMLKAANEGEQPMKGLLSELVASQNDSAAHVSLLEQTLTEFEDMLKVVRP